MSNIKTEILSTLKKLIGFYEEQPAVEAPVVEEVVETPQEESFKVFSASEIKISQMEVGGKVELIDANGELQPAPDDEYELETGEKFTVKDTLISAIEGREETKEEEPKEEEPVMEEMAKEEAPAEEPVVEINFQTQIEELKEELETLKTLFAEMKDQCATKDDLGGFTQQVEQLNTNIMTLAKVPVEFSKTSTNLQVKESKEERLIALARILGKK